MISQTNFQKRIEYQGDLKDVFLNVCSQYFFGSFISFTIIKSGYEDFNVRLKTAKGTFFVKVFNKRRSKKECQRLTNIIIKLNSSKINFPKIIKSKTGFLYEKKFNKVNVRLIVMKYISGKSFLSLKMEPSKKEAKIIIKQTAKINKLNIKPDFIYDSWATINVLSEFQKKKIFLSKKYRQEIEFLLDKFEKIKLNNLPHCFVHGDINKANILKDRDGRLFIIDFSVSNYSVRIVELAVLLSSTFFSSKRKEHFSDDYQFVLNYYRKFITLTKKEIFLLPLFINLSFVSYLLSSEYQRKFKNNFSKENNFWLNEAKAGFLLTKKLWSSTFNNL